MSRRQLQGQFFGGGVRRRGRQEEEEEEEQAQAPDDILASRQGMFLRSVHSRREGRDVDSAVTYAVTTIQAHYRGWRSRRQLANRMREQMRNEVYDRDMPEIELLLRKARKLLFFFEYPVDSALLATIVNPVMDRLPEVFEHPGWRATIPRLLALVKYPQGLLTLIPMVRYAVSVYPSVYCEVLCSNGFFDHAYSLIQMTNGFIANNETTPALPYLRLVGRLLLTVSRCDDAEKKTVWFHNFVAAFCRQLEFIWPDAPLKLMMDVRLDEVLVAFAGLARDQSLYTNVQLAIAILLSIKQQDRIRDPNLLSGVRSDLYIALSKCMPMLCHFVAFRKNNLTALRCRMGLPVPQLNCQIPVWNANVVNLFAETLQVPVVCRFVEGIFDQLLSDSVTHEQLIHVSTLIFKLSSYMKAAESRQELHGHYASVSLPPGDGDAPDAFQRLFDRISCDVRVVQKLLTHLDNCNDEFTHSYLDFALHLLKAQPELYDLFYALGAFCAVFSRFLVYASDEELLLHQEPAYQQEGASGAFSAETLSRVVTNIREMVLGFTFVGYFEKSRLMEYVSAGREDRSFQIRLMQMAEWDEVYELMSCVLRKLMFRNDYLKFGSARLMINMITVDHRDILRGLDFHPPQGIFTYAVFSDSSALAASYMSKEVLPFLLIRTLMKRFPYFFGFSKRVEVLCMLLGEERRAMEMSYFLSDIVVRIRRNYLYDDAFRSLSRFSVSDLKSHLKVLFRDSTGVQELGVDGGGLAREFVRQLLKEACDPRLGLFACTPDNCLYPNPASICKPDYESHFLFVGAMVGKAIYESLVIDLTFASFFLASVLLIGESSLDFNWLKFYDPVLYKNLVHLKKHKGDISELFLNFSVISDVGADTQVIDLKPDGSNTAVTEENKTEYAQLLSHYHMIKKIKPMVDAFRVGLFSMIDQSWLQMFSPAELQVLIGGGDSTIDVQDWKMHTRYVECRANSEPVLFFWHIVSGFSEECKRKLLRFSTSCSRPPLLGFGHLDPPFRLSVKITSENVLPTASTCANMLTIPWNGSAALLKKRLLMVLEYDTGFYLC